MWRGWEFSGRVQGGFREGSGRAECVWRVVSVRTLCHSERSEESGNQCESLCSWQILRLRCAPLRMTKGGGFRENSERIQRVSGRAVCVFHVVSLLSLFSPCLLSVLSLLPQNDATRKLCSFIFALSSWFFSIIFYTFYMLYSC